MANTFAPNGFNQYQGTGATPTYEQVAMAIASANTTPIFAGDPVIQATGTTGVGTGYITQAPVTAPTLAISGFALSNGIVTATFTTTSAPPIGSTLVLTGLTTATTLNGAWTVLSSTTTTATFAYAGAALSTQATTGYLYVPIAGVFIGCKYLSTSQKRTVWSPYWPGSDANGDVTAYIINDPNAQFVVQTANSNTTATAVGIASVGQNIGFNWNDSTATGETNGNTATGRSTYFADQYTLIANSAVGAASNAYLPFRVLGIQNYMVGGTSPIASSTVGANTDPTLGYDNIIVGFNYAMNNRPGAGI